MALDFPDTVWQIGNLLNQINLHDRAITPALALLQCHPGKDLQLFIRPHIVLPQCLYPSSATNSLKTPKTALLSYSTSPLPYKTREVFIFFQIILDFLGS